MHDSQEVPRAYSEGWHSRGYLPHFDGGEIAQVVTFRLTDSLPRSVLDRWEIELANLENKKMEVERRRRIEDHLDKGVGMAWMKDHRIARLVQNALFWQEEYFDRYVRNAHHYANAINYIENNPVKACLCSHRAEWEFSSARMRMARAAN